jgi:hypothetical protein
MKEPTNEQKAMAEVHAQACDAVTINDERQVRETFLPHLKDFMTNRKTTQTAAFMLSLDTDVLALLTQSEQETFFGYVEKALNAWVAADRPGPVGTKLYNCITRQAIDQI